MLTYHLIWFAGSEMKVQSHPTEGGLEHALVRLPSGSRHFLVREPNDLKGLNSTELVALVNMLRPGKPIKSFHDKEAATARAWSLLTTQQDIPTGDLAVQDEPETPPETPAPQPEGEDEMAAAKKTARGVRVKKEKTTNGTGRRSKYADDMKIRVLATENPKRKGSKAFKEFAKLDTGMTIAEAKAKGVSAAEIAYDVKHEFISVK